MYHMSRWNKDGMRPQSAEGSKAKRKAEALRSDWQAAGTLNTAVRELEAKERFIEIK
jgi:hypothetical protein